MIAENTIKVLCTVFENTTLAILPFLSQLNSHMFAPLYLELCIPITLSYERVRNQCSAVIGADSSAALSVYLTKTYSCRSAEARRLCLFSHRAPITPHCRGKANTESFTPRDRLSPDGDDKPEYHSAKFSLKHTLHVPAGAGGCEASVMYKVARSRRGNIGSENKCRKPTENY